MVPDDEHFSQIAICLARRRAGEFDVVHAFWVYPQGSLAVAAGAFLLRLPVVVSIGGGELVSLPQIEYGGARTTRGRVTMSLTLRMADAVSVPSRYAMLPASKIRRSVQCIPVGVDAKLFRGSTGRPCPPPWRLLQVAGLNQVKNQETLLKAMHSVAAERPGVILDCIGVDTLNGRMQRLARDLGIAALVRFHGSLTVDEIIPFYRNAHLFVQSSLHESMGAAVLEAAAAGVPVVGTGVGILWLKWPRRPRLRFQSTIPMPWRTASSNYSTIPRNGNRLLGPGRFFLSLTMRIGRPQNSRKSTERWFRTDTSTGGFVHCPIYKTFTIP